MKKISRRDFLRTAGSAVPVAALAPASLTAIIARSFSSSPESSRKVVVIGAGLAGLACAYELRIAGFDVTVIEARSRPGGRVRTYRDPFADGLYAEMGAEYVNAKDEYVRTYCKKFGLKILTAKLYDGIFVRGHRLKMADLKRNEIGLPYEGTKGGELFGQEAHYLRGWIEKFKTSAKELDMTCANCHAGYEFPTDKPAPRIEHLPTEVLALDNLSIADLLRKEGAPEDIVELYTYTNATERTARPEQLSALTVVMGHYMAQGFNEETDEGRILGGNDQLPKSFGKVLSGNILYRKPVRRIKHGKKEVEVWFEEAGKLTSITASRLVITMPFKVLREVVIEPEFSSGKMRSIRELSYGQVMKIAMQFKKRFWDQPGSLGQRIFTDTPLRRVYHHSLDQPGPRGILLSFTSAADAEKLGQMSPEERLTVARDTVRSIWKESPPYWEGGATKYWNEDPWIMGSYCFKGVGQGIDFLRLAMESEGRVHFAGEHTSMYGSSMDGAIESGVRANKEVRQASS